MILERFKQLFTGNDKAYGIYDLARESGVTKHASPLDIHYQAHLNGEIGLGLVPIQENGLCRFAAIDIDIDTIDHGTLYAEISKRRLPLNVCRSKSGGAHLYIFFREPGMPAPEVRNLLRRWAGLLGYPQAEVFPKQNKVGPDNVGNWINLPYFGGEATTRYAVGPTGALGLEEFLDAVKIYSGTADVDEEVDAAQAQMPPCLASLTKNGIKQGQRNQAVFNLAIFFRKSSPADWETKLAAHNQQYISPPLDFREIQGVVKSAARTKFQYTCNQSPLVDCCNRAECIKLPFGVGHMPWNEEGAFDELVVTNCRKLCTNPPRYIVEVNGRDIILEWEHLYQYKVFRSKVGEANNSIITGMKQERWEQKLRDLLANRTDIEAPEDASVEGLVLDKFHEFLTTRERAQQKEDLLRGIPVQVGEEVYFRMADFRRYLQGFKLDKYEGSELYLALRRDNCKHVRIRLNGKLTLVWSYPLNKLNEQTSEFTVPDFKKEFAEDM